MGGWGRKKGRRKEGDLFKGKDSIQSPKKGQKNTINPEKKEKEKRKWGKNREGDMKRSKEGVRREREERMIGQKR